jgi:uncharacterized protein YbaR (Trm112 family)
MPALVTRARAEVARHTAKPPDQGLVLDVGSGASPHPRADLVVDKYVTDDFERDLPLQLTRPLVVADGSRLPFADQAFAYAVALHVLEHSETPDRFAGELARVAPAGFVQVPSRSGELTFGWPFHPWLIDKDGEILVFEPRGDARAPCGTFFHDQFEASLVFKVWFHATRSHWHHSLEWRDRLEVRVAGRASERESSALDVERTVQVLSKLGGAGKLVPMPGELRRTLRCPLCQGELEAGSESLACLGCDRSYPNPAGVPVLLEEAAS